MWKEKLFHLAQKNILHSLHYQCPYIKSCSHEVAKHKSGVICQFHLTVPPLATTFSHNIKEDGNAIRDLTYYQMSVVGIPKIYF
jgi:hypothetical protein